MISDILAKAKKDLDDVILLIEDDLKSVKTGRAKPSLIEDVKVQVYESTMGLKELASISALDPRTLLISPWDKTILQEIEKAIASSGLNINPIVDNDVIRISIPSLTEETRKDLVKLVNQKLESSRRLIRQVRNEIKQKIDALEGESGVSEDDLHKWVEELQKLVGQYNEKIESLGRAKEKELMTI